MTMLHATVLATPWHDQVRNPKHTEILHKPVSDVGRPHSNMREADWAMKKGKGPGYWQHHNINHLTYIPEIIPYIDSFSSWDCSFLYYGCMMSFWVNYHAARYSAGSINSYNPRLKWAHTVVFWTGLFRLHVAWLIGVCGYFYSYEFLYTHVPPFKIRDPSPEGWKRCFDDGQTTYLARTAACIFPALGYAFWTGRLKRVYLFWGFSFSQSIYFEFCRPFFTGSILGLNFVNYQENDRDGRLGNLMPELERRIDPDTNRGFWIASYENFRLSHSRTYDEVQQMTHEYQPLRDSNLIMRNPYFNFQKATQNNRDQPLRYKTQLFKLPQVLDQRMLAGVYDRQDA